MASAETISAGRTPPRRPGVWTVIEDPSTEMTFPVTEPCAGDAAAAGAVSAAAMRQQLTSARFVVNPLAEYRHCAGASQALPARTSTPDGARSRDRFRFPALPSL